MAKKVDPKWPVLLESLKEPARLVVLAIIAWGLTVVVPQLDEKWIPAVTVVLKWLDKVVHEWKSETGTEGLWKGLVGF